jgi:two-component system LytT family response regulator
MRQWKVLIVDDEPLARRRLQLALGEVGGPYVLVGEASGRASALQLIERERPDILLLDIRMRDGSGFDVLDALSADHVPAVIFVTAFDEFATRAFDVDATDYLLKPVEFERLRLALDRAVEKLGSRSGADQLAELHRVIAALRATPAAEPPPPPESDFWIRRSTGGFVRVPAGSIDWAVIEEDYVRLHCNGRSYLLRDSIRGLAAKLDPRRFLQIHRSTLVRIDCIVEMVRGSSGLPEVVLTSGDRLNVGRIYARSLRRRFRGGA